MIEDGCILTGDCLKLLQNVADSSVNLILCDLPYGVTRSRCDTPIDLGALWSHYDRILAPRGVVALTGQGMFTVMLINSATVPYRYTIIWRKNKPRGFLNANRQPLRVHEDVAIFYRSQPVYTPQMTSGHSPVHSYTKHKDDGNSGSNYGTCEQGWTGGGSTERYPTSVWDIPIVNETAAVHPQQKPVELGRRLVLSYTKPGWLVLDNACGSGSFLVAAAMEGRRWIGMELDAKYAGIARTRCRNAIAGP